MRRLAPWLLLLLMGCSPSLDTLDQAIDYDSTPSWSAAEADPLLDHAWGDYDGDGWLDLAVAVDGFPGARIYRNEFGRDLRLVWVYGGDAGTAVAWGDVEQDGVLELAIADPGVGAVVASQSFDASWSASVEASLSGAVDIAWADHDGDSQLDLAVLQPDALRLYRNDLPGFSEVLPALPSLSTAVSMAWGECSGDDIPDVAIAQDFQPLTLFRSNGGPLDGSSARPVFGPSTDALAPVWGDMDADGVLDLLVSDRSTAPVAWAGGADCPDLSTPLWNTATGSFARDVAMGDIEGDGDLDVVEAELQFYLFRGGGPLPNDVPESVGDASFWESISLVDWDNDGDLEIFGHSSFETLQARELPIPYTGSDRMPLIESYGGTANSCAVVDVDGDRLVDFSYGVASGVRLAPTVAGGDNEISVASGSTAEATRLSWADADGDGVMELATVTPAGSVTLYTGFTGTGFDTATTVGDPGLNPRDLMWGDLDQDGDLDLAVASSSGLHLFLWESGSLEPGDEFRRGSYFAVDLGDVNGDRRPDIVAGGDGPDGTGVIDQFLSSEDGEWVPDALATGQIATRLLLEDLDQDGDLDLYAATTGATDLIFAGEDGLSAPRPVEPDPSDTEGALLEDFDGDGDLELARVQVDDGGQFVLSVDRVREGGIWERTWQREFGTLSALCVLPRRGLNPALGTADATGPVFFGSDRRVQSLPQTPTFIELVGPVGEGQRRDRVDATIHDGEIQIEFWLYDIQADPVHDVLLEWSNGTDWQPIEGLTLPPLAASQEGILHSVTWNLDEAGIWSDSVRIRATLAQRSNSVSDSFQIGRTSSTSRPFRVRSCGDALWVDNDGDGVPECAEPLSDCDDDRSRFPGAEELCDGEDNDCDGDLLAPGELDLDGDGERPCEGDCDDLDPARFSEGPEFCDGLDNDCDGLVPPDENDEDGDGERICEGDCDDTEPAARLGADGDLCDDLIDNDCDGVVDEGCARAVDDDGDGWTVGEGDCDDSDASVFPGAIDICNGIDDDCDGVAETGDIDRDGDGWPLCAGDCDDSDPARSPGAIELCNGLDDDCDRSIPSDAVFGEFDADGDGVSPCEGDCDDEDPDRLPGRTGGEDCSDGIDNDCDGSTDIGEDRDSDGVDTCDGDCDDSNPSVFPGAEEQCNNRDDDCDGIRDEGFDEDGDGFGPEICGGSDCDDEDPLRYPGAPELCDGEDNDCDPGISETIDADGDGATACDGGDCWEGRSDVYPGAPELCDHIDNDCDEDIDEDFDGDGDGWIACGRDCDDTDPLIHPGAVEICENLRDDDCAGDGDAECEEPFVLTPPGCGCSSGPSDSAPPGLWWLALLSLPLLRRSRS